MAPAIPAYQATMWLARGIGLGLGVKFGLILNENNGDDGSGDSSDSGIPKPSRPLPEIPADWDGTVPPAPGWVWHGPDAPGGERGGWVSPDGEESLHGDFNHGGDIGPHVDWNVKGANGGKERWRIFPDGRCLPK